MFTMPPPPPMTKKQKIIIISIVVLLVISYVGTLGLFATQNDEKPSEDSDSPGWTKTLSSVMSIFAKKVKLDDLKCDNSSVSVSSAFTLDNSSAASGSCTIRFTEDHLPGYKDRDENSIWKTEVELLSKDEEVKPLSNTKIYTKYQITKVVNGKQVPDPGSCTGKTKDEKEKTVLLPVSALGLIHLTSKIDKDGKVEENKYYTESDLNCWLEQKDTSVSFTISQANESLILTTGCVESCKNDTDTACIQKCSSSPPIKLKLTK